MSRTIGEITIAIIIAVLVFRIGVEIAPLIMDWWRDMTDSVNDERNTDDDRK